MTGKIENEGHREMAVCVNRPLHIPIFFYYSRTCLSNCFILFWVLPYEICPNHNLLLHFYWEKVKYSHLVPKYICQHELFVDFWSFLEDADLKWFFSQLAISYSGWEEITNRYIMARTPSFLRVVGFLYSNWGSMACQLVYDYGLKQR